MTAAAQPLGGGEDGARERRYTELSTASLLRMSAARPGPVRFRPEDGADAEAATRGDAAGDAGERVGVLLLNLGGPEKLEDVQPFLYNLFADPDIIRLPAAVSFMQKPLATLISTLRAPKACARA